MEDKKQQPNFTSSSFLTVTNSFQVLYVGCTDEPFSDFAT